jgi:hypothetical protein
MTHAEAYAELEKDRDNVARWFDHQAVRLRRQALKMQKFPVTWWLDYTSPRKNRYLIGVTCTRRNFDKYHAVSTIALRREQRGYSVYLTPINSFSPIKKTVFVQHVFERYAERANVDKQGMDLIRHFLEHQSGGHVITDQRLAGRSVRYNGRNHKFIAVQEGVMLGDVEDGIFIVRTFITYDMATGLQRDKFTYAQGKLFDVEEEIEYSQKFFKQLNNNLI